VQGAYGPSGICGRCERAEWGGFCIVEIYCCGGMLGQRASWVVGQVDVGGCCCGGHLRPERVVGQRGFTSGWAFSHSRTEQYIVLRPNVIRGWWWSDSGDFPSRAPAAFQM
jgi:hypothetical protein